MYTFRLSGSMAGSGSMPASPSRSVTASASSSLPASTSGSVTSYGLRRERY